ncbi:HNH endonuclease [Egicoccus halophilus]|uniref:HNH nuclease domain-containing protein n=1 Tax=Egicoccus halophilus TaxID=1670830 RepID=A0A8J3AH83_9ACTN|nr:hypothetical protein GCM10011354_32770 [Egicoccus halophilus]
MLLRDAGRCRFPGCVSRRNLHVHHVLHWADGGPTERANLVTLCAFHHRHLHRLHDRGRPLRITVDPTGSHTFRTVDGHHLPHAGPTAPTTEALGQVIASRPISGRTREGPEVAAMSATDWTATIGGRTSTATRIHGTTTVSAGHRADVLWSRSSGTARALRPRPRRRRAAATPRHVVPAGLLLTA